MLSLAQITLFWLNGVESVLPLFPMSLIPAVEGNDCGAEIYDLVTSGGWKKINKMMCLPRGRRQED